MGQVQPRGPNVVRINETGGGKDCDCGPPHLEEGCYFDPRLASVGISELDFRNRLKEVNEIMKQHYIPLPKVIGAFVSVAILPHIILTAFGGSERQTFFIIVVALVPMVLIFAMIGIMIRQGNRREAEILQRNNDWRQRGVQVVYCRAQKHSNGALFLILPPGTAPASAAPIPVTMPIGMPPATAVPVAAPPIMGAGATAVPVAMPTAASAVLAAPVAPVVAPCLMQVQIPAGAAPGSVLQVQAPDGRMVQLKVPNGATEGTLIQVQF